MNKGKREYALLVTHFTTNTSLQLSPVTFFSKHTIPPNDVPKIYTQVVLKEYARQDAV